jgi:hypothetical protein
MRIPALLYGDQVAVWKRCRTVMARAMREGQPLVSVLEADGMLDTADHPGLLVLAGPRPLLSKTNHFQCFMPSHVFVHDLKMTPAPADPAVEEAFFQTLLPQPWGLLCLLCGRAHFRNDNIERYRHLVRALLPHWQGLDAEGARYTSDSDQGGRLWFEPTTLPRALYFVGVPEDRLRRDLPAGGIVALVAEADRAQAGDLADFAATVLAPRFAPEPSLFAYAPSTNDPPPAYMSEQMEAALRANDAALVQRLVAGGEPIDVIDQAGTWSLLLWAAHRGHTELVRFLLDRGADIEDRWVEGESPLMVAAWHGHLDTVQLLLDRGADPNYVTDKGWDVVQFAEMGGNPEVIALAEQVFSGSPKEEDSEE